MPHILFDGWEERMEGLSTAATTIHEAIDNDEYEGEQLAAAEALMVRAESLESGIDPFAKPGDDLLTDMQSFLA